MSKCMLSPQLLLSLLLSASVFAQPGKQLWEFPGVIGTPSLGPNGNIYAYSGGLICLNAFGKLQWRALEGVGIDASRSVPVIGVDGTVFVNAYQFLYSLDSDGRQNCSFDLGVNSHSSYTCVNSEGASYWPVMVDGGLDYVLAMDSNMVPKWRFILPASEKLQSLSAPAIGADATIYVMIQSLGSSGLLALKSDGSIKWRVFGNGLYGTSVTLGPEGVLHVGNSALDPNGSAIWSNFDYASAYYNPVSSPSGVTYSVNGNPLLAVVPLFAKDQSGNTLWKYPPSTVGSRFTSGPALASDGTIYICSGDLSLYALKPDGQEAWHYTASSVLNTSPIIGPNGTVYVRSIDSVLHAIQGGAPPEYNSWSMAGMDARNSRNFPARSKAVIVKQPVSESLPKGYDLTFSVAAGGFPPPLFQWRYEDQDILGATYSALTLTNIQPFYAGHYSVFVSNSLGQALSDVVTLTVKDTSTPVIQVNGVRNSESKVIFSLPVQIDLSTRPITNSIYYTLDGSVPDRNAALYSGSFVIKKSSTLRAIAYDPNSGVGAESDPVHFEKVPAYPLFAPAGAGGQIMNQCGGYSPGPFTSNATIVATATAGDGWRFLKWLGDSQSSDSTVSLTMDSPKWLYPVFGQILFSTNIGAGKVLFPAARSLFPFGSSVRLSAVPDPGSYFVAWTNVVADNQNPLNVVFTNSTANPVAVFQPLPTNKFTLIVTSSGNGDVTLDRLPNLPLLFNKGQQVTLNAKPDPHQTFAGWTGDVISTNNPLTVTIDKTKRVDAQFTDNPVIQVGRYFTGVGVTNFVFSVTSLSNSVYVVEHSTDLRTWRRLNTVFITDGIAGFSEPLGAGSTSNYYRLKLP